MGSANTSGERSKGAGANRCRALLFCLCALLAQPVLAQSDGARRGGPPRPDAGEAPTMPQWQILHERHEIRRDVREDGSVIERHRVMRERWQQISPEDRQKLIEQRRQLRQLSPEERQQLRRDILEAYRPPHE